MSAAEHSRDDAEPPSSSVPNQYSVSISIDETVDTTAIPSSEQITAWVEHAIAGVPSRETRATHYELSLSITSESAIQALNLEYRANDKPTNVLSFPSGMPLMTAEAGDTSFQTLGDIVVCQPVIVQEAEAQNKSTQHHFAHMIVHSVLHLFGYDHETEEDALAMEALEIQLLDQLSIPNPYQLSFQNQ